MHLDCAVLGYSVPGRAVLITPVGPTTASTTVSHASVRGCLGSGFVSLVQLPSVATLLFHHYLHTMLHAQQSLRSLYPWPQCGVLQIIDLPQSTMCMSVGAGSNAMVCATQQKIRPEI